LGQDTPGVDCTITVEITGDMIQQCLKDAFTWWSVYRGLFREEIISLVENQTEYDLSTISPGVEKVVRIIPQQENWKVNATVLYPGFLDINLLPYGMAGTMGGMYPQTTITQALQTLKTNEYVLGTDFTWDFYYENVDETTHIRTLRVMPAPRFSGNAIILYRVDPLDLTLSQLNSKDLHFVRDYGLALAKEMLGRIWGKYDSLPAAGGDKSLNKDLIGEAREDKAMLEEKLLGFDGPIMPVVG